MATTIVLAQRNIGPGTFTSASTTVPNPPGFSLLTIQSIMTTAQRTNPAVTYNFRIERFDPVAGVWKLEDGGDYIGGNYVSEITGLPVAFELTLVAGAVVGLQVRAVLDLPQQLNIGAQIITT